MVSCQLMDGHYDGSTTMDMTAAMLKLYIDEDMRSWWEGQRLEEDVKKRR